MRHFARAILGISILLCTACSTPPTVQLSILNTSDKTVEVSLEGSEPVRLAPKRTILKKAQLNQVIMVGEKMFDLIPDEFGEHRAAILVTGPKVPMVLADFSDFYSAKGERSKPNPQIEIVGLVDKDVFPFGNGVSDIRIAAPGYLPKYSGKHAYRLVPLPQDLPEEKRLDYLHDEVSMLMRGERGLKEAGLNIAGQNRYRRFMPESGWVVPKDSLKGTESVSVSVSNLSPSPIAFRRNAEQLGVVIPSGETARWLSARRTDSIRLMESNGEPLNTEGEVLRELKLEDVLGQSEEHVLIVNDPKEKFEFLLADYTSLAEGRPPTVGEFVRAKDDIAVLEPYDLVWGFEERMPPPVQWPGRVMRLMVIKPEIPEKDYKAWAEAGVNYVQKQIKAGKYK